MIARTLIAALNKIGKDVDQSVLHLRDLLAFCLDVLKMPYRIGHHLLDRTIQRFKLITGRNLKFGKPCHSFVELLIGIVGKLSRCIRHRIDRVSQVILHVPQAINKDHYKEADKERSNLGDESDTIQRNILHGHDSSRSCCFHLLDRKLPVKNITDGTRCKCYKQHDGTDYHYDLCT